MFHILKTNFRTLAHYAIMMTTPRLCVCWNCLIFAIRPQPPSLLLLSTSDDLAFQLLCGSILSSIALSVFTKLSIIGPKGIGAISDSAAQCVDAQLICRCAVRNVGVATKYTNKWADLGAPLNVLRDTIPIVSCGCSALYIAHNRTVIEKGGTAHCLLHHLCGF